MAMVDAGKNMGCIIADGGDCGNLIAKSRVTPTYMAVRSCGGRNYAKLSKYAPCNVIADEVIRRYQWDECGESEFYCLPNLALCLLYSPNHDGIIPEDLLLSRLHRCVVFWPNAMMLR
jgi:hypothetical protein